MSSADPSPRPPRLTRRALPPYAFVPGHFPHPSRDEGGHSRGQPFPWGAPPSPSTWAAHPTWPWALDLFNQGYYWEAHEGFEAFWRSCAEPDPRRALFQGLLRLSAAGVKARQGRAAGIHSHATQAAILLTEALGALGPAALGLDLRDAVDQAERLALKAHTFPDRPQVPATEILSALRLRPAQNP